jgi:U3 small nucleolar RNA-associated protein 7
LLLLDALKTRNLERLLNSPTTLFPPNKTTQNNTQPNKQLVREPSAVAKERKAAAEAANAARLAAQRDKAEEKAKMKGKNKPTRRHRRKQLNVIEDKKPAVRARMDEEAARKAAAAEAAREERLASVPRALQRFAR